MKVARRVLCLLGLLASVAGSAGAALAQDQANPSPGTDADHAARGERAYRAKRYSEAAREFEQAYQTGGHPSHLYNMAQAYRLAGETQLSLQCYRGYLQLMSDPPNRDDIESHIAELEAELRARRAAARTPAPGPLPAAESASPYAPATAAPDPNPGYAVPPQVSPQAPPYAPAGQAGTYPGAAPWNNGAPWGAAPPAYGAYPGQAPAQPNANVKMMLPPGAREHDGTFFRMQIGAGYMTTTFNSADLTLSGGSGSFSLALGGSLTRSFVLYGELHSGAITDATVTTAMGSQEVTGADASMFGVGAGAAFFLEPSNFYTSLSLALCKATLTFQGQTGETDYGPGLLLSVGKEWWASDQLGLGLALQLHASAVNDDNATTTTAWGALVLSATYN